MTPEERAAAAANSIWYWLPARWFNGTSWFDIKGYVVTDLGMDVQVSKDDGDVVLVSFTDDEISGQLNPTAAKARVEAV